VVDIALAIVVVPLIALLWHESAHAVFALAVTRGPVLLQAGFGPTLSARIGRLTLKIGPLLVGGVCVHEGAERRGDRALVAAAGPVSSAFLAALAWNLRSGLHGADPFFVYLLGDLAVMSVAMVIVTALPIRYPGGPLMHAGESDGLTILRALFPASRLALPAPRGARRPERPLRAPFVAVLVVTTPAAFIASFWIGLLMVALFGFAYLGERR
jgi:hypothetical protein